MKIKTLIRNSQKYILENFLKKPTQVILEPTNRCNLNCPYCLVGMQNDLIQKHGNVSHDLLSRPQGMMDRSTFDTIVGQLQQFGIKKVYLHFQGEPFLNKLTPTFGKILKEKGFDTGVFTNGLAFTDKNIAETAEAEFGLVRFSVDGASQETYVKNRVGGQFDKVVENMRKVVLAHKDKSTRVEWQFLPMRNNEHEVEAARALANDIGIHFFLKGYRETDPELSPLNQEYRSQFHKKPCKDIYHQIGIFWNGDVVPCCYDPDGKEIMGNLKESSLDSLWENHVYKEFRKKVDHAATQPENEPEICKNCLRWK